MKVFKRTQHIFFSGIGGIGMSGIAEILLESGYRVSGSDRVLTDITTYLEQHGAVIYEGHRPENITDADALVYSSAVPADNPERMEAARRGIPQIRRAEMLAETMRLKYGIAVAGTHGKTTTTAMLSEIFIQAGLDPTVVIGGRLHSLKTNARLGKGEFFITEADEYDRSFLTLSPVFSIITSIDADHLDCYKDLEDIYNTFLEFTRKIPFYGCLIACFDNNRVRKLAGEANCPVVSYGTDRSNTFYPEDIHFSELGSSFSLVGDQNTIGTLHLKVPGMHNILNAIGAAALAMEAGIAFKDIQAALNEFRGVERRFQLKGTRKDIMVFDDYAHHPTEIEATLTAAKKGFPGRRLVAVFQPHLYSRTRDFYREFAEALNLADVIVLTDIYPAREDPIPGISSQLIVTVLQKSRQQHIHLISDRHQVAGGLRDLLKAGDLVITLGAGDIWKSGEDLLKQL
jgi:UDP-N-acetylmuramate--alanine ligase